MQAREWISFSCVALGVLLAGLNMSIVDVVLPTISASLGADTFAATWFVLAYSLATCAFILSFGRLADILGRRPIYVGGLVALGVGAVLCALADAPGLFVAGRAVQGVGSAMVLANSTAILVDVFSARHVSTALGMNVAVMAGAQAAGPLVSGFIEATFDWRSIFVIVACVATVGMVWGAINLPRTRGQPGSFDFVGAALSAIALLLVLLTLSRVPVTGWSQPSTIIISAAALVAVILFLLSQRFARAPLVSPVVFADRARSLALLSTFLMSLPRGGLVLLISLVLQILHGRTPLEAGQVAFVAALAVMSASPFAGLMVRSLGVYLLCLITPLITLVGIMLVYFSGMEGVASLVGLALVGIGAAWFMTPNTASIMMSVDSQQRGITNGLRSTLQSAGSAVSAVIVMSMLPIFVPLEARQSLLVGVPHTGTMYDGLVNGQNLVMIILMAICVVAFVIAAARKPLAASDSEKRES